MSEFQPLYTSESCNAAFQLRWSLAVFPKQPLPPQDLWLPQLAAATERDQVRILEVHVDQASTQFLVSTHPAIHPPAIVKSVKGRLMHSLRPLADITLKRNFRLSSVGEANANTVEDYVAKQLEHHPLASDRSQQKLEQLQRSFSDVNLCQPVNSAHGQYVIGLHLVLVHAERWRTVELTFLERTQQAVLAIAARKNHSLSRVGILPDHLHLTLRPHYEHSPAEVALWYMNNIAYWHGQVRIWMDSYYVGTIGPYDMQAIRSHVAGDASD